MKFNKNQIRSKIDDLVRITDGIYNNLAWNFGGLVSAAALVIHPKVLYLQNIPAVIEVDGIKIDGFQCLGLTLLGVERKTRSNELISAAKRSLLCDSIEIGADSLIRASSLVEKNVDPYELDEFFSVDIKELWNSKKGKAGYLLSKADRIFFEKCATKLRNVIRHNNAVIPSKKEIVYEGKPREKHINVSFIWTEGGDNNIKLSLSGAFNIFDTTSKAISAGLKKAKTMLKE